MPRRAILVVAFSLFLLAMAAIHAPIDVIAQHDDDTIQIEEGAVTTITIDCPSGIESATVSRKLIRWPEMHVVLKLRALEGFVVRTDDEIHRMSVNSEGVVLVEPVDSVVLHMNESEPIENTHVFSVSVDPGKLAETVSEFRLEWVDYYR